MRRPRPDTRPTPASEAARSLASAQDGLIADLQRRLDRASDPDTRRWFENYLKHAVGVRGVRTPDVERVVAEWQSDHGVAERTPEDRLELAVALIRQAKCEDKLAGILLIQKRLLRRLDAGALLDAVERLFRAGAIRDWSTNDWLCARIVGPLVRREGLPVAERVAGWTESPVLWQRRSAAVSLRTVAADDSFRPLIARVTADLLRERERFVQTGAGWLIADLSRHAPEFAAALVERHFERLTAEVVRRHLKRLPDYESYKERKRKRPGGPRP